MEIKFELERDYSLHIKVFCDNFNCKKEELIIHKKIDKCIVEFQHEHYEIINNDELVSDLHKKVSNEFLASKILPTEIVTAFGDSPEVFSNEDEYSNFLKEFSKLEPSKEELRIFKLIISFLDNREINRKDFWNTIYNINKKISNRNNIVFNLYGKCVVAIFNADEGFKNEAVHYIIEKKYTTKNNYFIEEEEDEAFLIKKIKFDSKISKRITLIEKHN